MAVESNSDRLVFQSPFALFSSISLFFVLFLLVFSVAVVIGFSLSVLVVALLHVVSTQLVGIDPTISIVYCIEMIFSRGGGLKLHLTLFQSASYLAMELGKDYARRELFMIRIIILSTVVSLLNSTLPLIRALTVTATDMRVIFLQIHFIVQGIAFLALFLPEHFYACYVIAGLSFVKSVTINCTLSISVSSRMQEDEIKQRESFLSSTKGKSSKTSEEDKERMNEEMIFQTISQSD